MIRQATVLLAAALLCGNAFAKGPTKLKDPCKGVTATQDSFATTRSFESGDLKLVKTNDAWSLSLGFNKGGGYGAFTATTTEIIPAETQVDMILEDGTQVLATSSAQSGPTQVYIMGVAVTTYKVPLTMSAEALASLAKSPLKAFRVMKGAEAMFSGEAKSGDSKKLSETLTCMLANEPTAK